MLGLLAIHLENDEVSLYFALYVQINSRHTKETNVKTKALEENTEYFCLLRISFIKINLLNNN